MTSLYGKMTIRDYLKKTALPYPTPGAGSSAAIIGAISAALVQMAAALTVGKTRYLKVESLMKNISKSAQRLNRRLVRLAEQDSKNYQEVILAIEKEKEGQKVAALKKANVVPREVLKICTELKHLSKMIERAGNRNTVAETRTAFYLAEAALKSSHYIISYNLKIINKIDNK